MDCFVASLLAMTANMVCAYARKMAPCGAISVSSSVVVMMSMLDDNDPAVMVAMAPAFVPAEVAMVAELGAGAEMMMFAAAPDHDVLGACNRRRRNSDRAKRSDNVSKLLHVALLQ
jgi:hypothetical protein